MKKQVLAYTRTPLSQLGQSKSSNKDLSQETIKYGTNESKTPSNSIYQAIMGQMAVNHSEYMNKLISKENKGQKRQNQFLHDQSYEKTKSYSTMMAYPSTSERKVLQNIQNYENSPFYSHKETPTANKGKFSLKTKTRKNQNSFLTSLDNYINAISEVKERKSCEKSKENASYFQILKKIESSDKKIKELKLNNHILKMEETKQRKKNRQLKDKLHDMLDHMRKLTNDLERQRTQRKKIQSLFKEFQQKFSMFCPQKKHRSAKKHHQFFQQNPTQLDQQFDMMFTKHLPFSQHKSRSSRKNSSSKIHKFHQQLNQSSDSFFIPPRHFQESDQSEFPYK